MVGNPVLPQDYHRWKGTGNGLMFTLLDAEAVHRLGVVVRI